MAFLSRGTRVLASVAIFLVEDAAIRCFQHFYQYLARDASNLPRHDVIAQSSVCFSLAIPAVVVARPDKISGADINAICQEAGMLAVRENRYIVLAKDFEKAYKTQMKKDEQDMEFYK